MANPIKPNVQTMPDAKSEFSNPRIENLVKANKHELALLNAQDKDVLPILKDWAKKYTSVNVNDEKSLNLIKNWYTYFKSPYNKTNPFFDYLKFLKGLGVKPKYNDLVAVNNKYQERILNDKDLHSGDDRNEVLENEDFYNKPIDYQNHWLDVYAYFSDKNKVNEVLKNVPNGTKIKMGNDTFAIEDLSRTNVLRDSILFDGGNPASKLRDPRSIDNIMDKLSEFMPDNGSNQNNRREWKDYDKLKDFIEKNKDSLNDLNLLKDIQTFVNRELQGR